MSSSDIFYILEFSQEWVDLGIITPAQLKQFEVEWTKGEDRNTEHYLWRAFLDFIKSKELLDEAIAGVLYKLGASDPDSTMGGAMMAHILRHNDCPKDLLEAAAKSEERFLQQIASARLAAKRAK